jgi:hypothetical protein
MSVTLSPSAPRYAVSDADDPFKKYWWAILMMIVFTGLWLLTPMLGEKSVGSISMDTSKPKVEANVEQAVAADAGAGDGINLSMDGTGHKRKEDGMLASSLYQAPPDDPAAAATAGSAALGSASGSASGSTLASALKKVGESGGWAEKAQKGFNAPKLAGATLSGMGAASGGSAGASGSSAFGSRNANIGFAGTHGLSGGSDIEAAPESKGIAALKAASSQSLLAAGNKSNDGARNNMSQVFDGAKAGNKIGGGGAVLNGAYAALDAAPVNLKISDPKLNEKKLEPPPGADVGASESDPNSQLGKQIAMQVAGAVLGAVIGGPVGGVVTSVVMQAVQRQMDQEEKIRKMEEQNQMNQQRRRLGLPSASSPS